MVLAMGLAAGCAADGEPALSTPSRTDGIYLWDKLAAVATLQPEMLQIRTANDRRDDDERRSTPRPGPPSTSRSAPMPMRSHESSFGH